MSPTWLAAAGAVSFLVDTECSQRGAVVGATRIRLFVAGRRALQRTVDGTAVTRNPSVSVVLSEASRCSQNTCITAGSADSTPRGERTWGSGSLGRGAKLSVLDARCVVHGRFPVIRRNIPRSCVEVRNTVSKMRMRPKTGAAGKGPSIYHLKSATMLQPERAVRNLNNNSKCSLLSSSVTRLGVCTSLSSPKSALCSIR